jgi:hypothetical protein
MDEIFQRNAWQMPAGQISTTFSHFRLKITGPVETAPYNGELCFSIPIKIDLQIFCADNRLERPDSGNHLSACRSSLFGADS